MKAVLTIADGMADVPLKELDGKTPLEEAQKPSLDLLAEKGICGMIHVIAPGVPPGSDTAHLALLGYDVMEVYTGRGALEAIGSGIDILPNDLAFRCNFATVNKDFEVIDRRAGRIGNEDASRLAEAIDESLRFDPPEVGGILFNHTIEHRAILRLSGPNLSTLVSDTDPGQVGAKVLEARALDGSREARNTADILNKLTRRFNEVLQEHPVNKKRVKKEKEAAKKRREDTLENLEEEKKKNRGAASLGQAKPDEVSDDFMAVIKERRTEFFAKHNYDKSKWRF